MTDLDAEEIREILWGHEDYETVVGEAITGKSRWSTFYEQVVKRLTDDTFWSITWSQGSTEYQEDDFEPEVTQVVPVEVTVTKYVPLVQG